MRAETIEQIGILAAIALCMIGEADMYRLPRDADLPGDVRCRHPVAMDRYEHL
jgi:hypothetical protein